MSLRILQIICFISIFVNPVPAQIFSFPSPPEGYEDRIKKYIDSLKVFDTHEHLVDPCVLADFASQDFTLLLLENSFDDLTSAGLPDTLFDQLYNSRLTPVQKWKIIEPWWNRSFNTTSNRIVLRAINDLYNIPKLDINSVETLSRRLRENFKPEWFHHVLRDRCKIEYVIEDVDKIQGNNDYIRHVTRFCDWLSVRTKKVIDSLAIMQVEPIYTLESFVKSMERAFETARKEGMAGVKINLAYQRPLNFEDVTTEAARKVFRTLINGNEDIVLSFKDAKPLQDYMVHQLLKLAEKYSVPVAFHTGLQAGDGNYITNSNPVLLINLFEKYRGVNFVLFHAGYPYGGELSALAKNFRNVHIDMNWIYSISPDFARRYLGEWLQSVPAGKIMAFGGDQRMVELTYGNLVVAKEVIADVLIEKVKDGYFTETEAKNIANMILYQNAMDFYKIK